MDAAEQNGVIAISWKAFDTLIETNHNLSNIASKALKDLAERDELIKELEDELNFYKGARRD